MHNFKPIIITDLRTGSERIVRPEEQMLMLEQGILLDVAFKQQVRPNGRMKNR